MNYATTKNRKEFLILSLFTIHRSVKNARSQTEEAHNAFQSEVIEN